MFGKLQTLSGKLLTSNEEQDSAANVSLNQYRPTLFDPFLTLLCFCM